MPPGRYQEVRREDYLGIGVVFQMPDQTRPEFTDIGFDLPDILPESVQLGQHDLIGVSPAVPMSARYQSPGHDDDQDSDGSDNLRDDISEVKDDVRELRSSLVRHLEDHANS